MVVQKSGGGFTQPMMKAGVVPKLEVANSTLATSLRVNGSDLMPDYLGNGPDLMHTSRMTLADDVNMEEFVMNRDEFSGADIKAICTEAGLLALRERRMKTMRNEGPEVIANNSSPCRGQRLLQTVGPDLTALSTKELVGLVHRLRFYKAPLTQCKFDVQLQDSTGLIVATAFAEIAEKLFKVTAEELYANTINGELALHCMERLSDSRDYVIDIRASKYDAQQSSLCRFFVNAVYDVATLMPSDDLSLEKTTKKNPRETGHNEASSDLEPIISDSSKLVAEEASNTNKPNSKKKKKE
ncbi:hypothetical protein Vadar_001602 [Vaccinium darrowii]|uniref:Uncharacterized protein n=1 Tax=Vaccinium darrowii TaxID=229202 RepID=A0ACB7Z8S5_9ERIC|nr:hypothetical protein Vadar_001602 [Vaccinium darrowii]